mgnify:CR=1 FL=1
MKFEDIAKSTGTGRLSEHKSITESGLSPHYKGALTYNQWLKEHDTEKDPIKNLQLVDEQKLNYNMSFNDSHDMINLLSMTPFAFKTTKSVIEQLKATTDFNCQADFLIRLYKK